jgi:membrane associated rhomboid family serine protease
VAAVLALVFAATYGHLLQAAEQFGLIPAQAARYGGLTLLSCFFLHGGLGHLIANTYFLLVFGDNVEDCLGRWKYVVLLVVATLVGSLLHVLGDLRDQLPCVGASGGISGVITFYALAFPKARLGIMIRYWFVWRWLYLPAWAAFICWLLLQLLLVYFQVAGLSNVSALGHLGGASVGLAAWLWWRKR